MHDSNGAQTELASDRSRFNNFDTNASKLARWVRFEPLNAKPMS